MSEAARPEDVQAVSAAEQSVRRPEFVALIDMLRRTGMDEFQIRYSDDQHPVVWMAIGHWRIDRHGKPTRHGRYDSWEAAAGIDPYRALVRLADEMMDGGTCKHCGRPAGVTDDWRSEMPLAAVICWYIFDPELEKFRRSCEGD